MASAFLPPCWSHSLETFMFVYNNEPIAFWDRALLSWPSWLSLLPSSSSVIGLQPWLVYLRSYLEERSEFADLLTEMFIVRLNSTVTGRGYRLIIWCGHLAFFSKRKIKRPPLNFHVSSLVWPCLEEQRCLWRALDPSRTVFLLFPPQGVFSPESFVLPWDTWNFSLV